MKKIFYTLMTAIVALGAVACNNEIDENLATTESLSIEVVISEATRIALTDNGTDENGNPTQKLGFEDGDKLLVTTAWGGDTTNSANNFWFTYSSETGLFTCTAEGVGALKGQERNVFHLATHPEKGLVGGVLCDSEAGLNGVALVGSTSALGEEAITLNAYPILKYTSEYEVTFTAGKSVFGAIKSWGIGQYAEYTFPAGTDVYVPLFSNGTMNFSASIKGEVVKEKELTFENNKIYNLGTLEANPEESADGDPAGIDITIDGVFTDWANITKNVATVTEGANYTIMKTMKAYADAENIYVYAEMIPNTTTVHWGLCLDLDTDPATGYTKAIWDAALQQNWKAFGCEVVINDQCVYNNEIIEYAWGSNVTYNRDGSSLGSFTFNGAKPVFENGVIYVEIAIPYSEIPEITTKNISVVSYVKDNWALAGALPGSETLIIPVHN